jgi:hypothetical protein
MKTLLTASTFLFSAFAFANAAQAENRTFVNPKVSGDKLDLCLNWGEGCGKPAADEWCVKQGFETSIAHTVANDVGAMSRTRLVTTGAVCDQAFCDAISKVTCLRASAPAPAMQIYVKPRHNGMRLDLCVNWGVGCGQPAANAYCLSKGWNQASNFSIAHDIGTTRPTRLIGTGAVCDQGYCDGFRQITCTN